MVAMSLLDWMPQAPKIEIVQEDEKWLVIDPAAPNWIVTTFAGALLVGLCDGRTRVGDLVASMERACGRSCEAIVLAFFRRLQEIGFFEPYKCGTVDPSPSSLAAVYLNVTETCNMRCPYCYMSSGPEARSDELSAEEIAGVLRDIYAINSNTHIVIAGGEPLVRKDIGQIFSLINHRGFPATLITNGSLIKPDLLEDLRSMTAVQVSVDGSTAEIHDKTRSHFDRVWRGVEWLKSENVPVRVSAAINAFNYDDIGNLMRKCDAAGVELTFSYAQPLGRGNENRDLCVSPGKVFELMRGLSADRPSESATLQDTGLPGSFARRHRRQMCGVGESLISIAPNGDVFPCHALHRPDLKMGNVRDSALPEILTSPVVSRVRVPVDDIRDCDVCSYRYLCGGGCRASTYWKEETVRTRYPGCALSRRTVRHNLFEGPLVRVGSPD